VKWRIDVFGIFPNEAAIMRLIGTARLESNDEWQTSSSDMVVDAFEKIDKEEFDPILSKTGRAL
jgi:hypothetical protein